MGIEEDLFEAMKFTNLGGKMPQNKMVQAIVRNAQIGALKHLRGQLDGMINKLAKQGVDVKGMGELDPFRILGVDPNATKEEVQKAYRKKAAEAHPDRGGPHEQMVKVNAAWETIKKFKGWK